MISAYVLVKNEADILPVLLPRLRENFRQVLVVDTGSTDGSVEIAKQLATHVAETELDWDFSAARNYGMQFVNQPWTFQCDADEWPTDDLLKWMKHQVPRSYAGAYKVHRYNTLDGHDLGDMTHEWHIRLFRSFLRYASRIHERICVNPYFVEKAPERCILLHAKTMERQHRQDEFYKNWVEQPCSLLQLDKQ